MRGTRVGHAATEDPAHMGYKRLVCAALLRAARDAQAGDPGAALWLMGEQAEVLFDFIDWPAHGHAEASPSPAPM